MHELIYLDNNATTALHPAVIEEMQKEFALGPANPSSVHSFGRKAKALLLSARTLVADFFSVTSKEVLFTSGGTESLNLLIRGLLPSLPPGEILSSNIEHSALFNTIEAMKAFTPRFLPAGLWGAVRPDELRAALTPNTRLIALGAANSETGVKIDLSAIAAIAEEHKIPLVIDGVALLGKELFTLPKGVSGIAFSGHKIHGPKGIGIAIVRSHLTLTPLHTGGGQEFGKRGGTENLAGILGFAKAIALLKEELPAATDRMRALRDHFETSLRAQIPNLVVHGHGPRICNTSSLGFPGVDAESLLIQLDRAGIAASHGSACSSGALEPSRVLLNMGISREMARSSLRFSLSRYTTRDEVDVAVRRIVEQVAFLKRVG